MGKGCKPRPIEIERDEYEDNWDYIFKREKKNDNIMKHHRKPKNDKES